MGCTALLALAGAVLLGGRQGAAAISSVGLKVSMPRSVRVFPGPPFVVQRISHVDGIAPFALLLLVVGVVGIGLTVLYWSPWNGSRIGPWEIRRHRVRSGDPRRSELTP
jgi:hypothetical protein